MSVVPVGHRGIELSSMEELFRFAEAVSMSQLCPPGFSKTDIFLIIQNGLEVGMSPMAALSSTYIVNKRATIFGDMPLALVRQSGLLEDYKQEYSGTPYNDDYTCTVTTMRRNTKTPITVSYSVKNAKTARLWGKEGAWTSTPDRMLLYRARGFCLKDNFPDVLRGCSIGELNDEVPSGFQNAKPATVLNSVRAQIPQRQADPEPLPEAEAKAEEQPAPPPEPPRKRSHQKKPAPAPAPEDMAHVEAEDVLFSQEAGTDQDPIKPNDLAVQVVTLLHNAGIPEKVFISWLKEIGCASNDVQSIQHVKDKFLKDTVNNWPANLEVLTVYQANLEKPHA